MSHAPCHADANHPSCADLHNSDCLCQDAFLHAEFPRARWTRRREARNVYRQRIGRLKSVRLGQQKWPTRHSGLRWGVAIHDIMPESATGAKGIGSGVVAFRCTQLVCVS